MTPFETLQSLCPSISAGMSPIEIIQLVGVEYRRSRPQADSWLEVEFCVGHFRWRLTESPDRHWEEVFQYHEESLYSDFGIVVIDASIQALSEAKKSHQQHNTAIAISAEDSGVIGRCEGCSRYILEDMQHMVFIDGEILCTGCFSENNDGESVQ